MKKRVEEVEEIVGSRGSLKKQNKTIVSIFDLVHLTKADYIGVCVCFVCQYGKETASV